MNDKDFVQHAAENWTRTFVEKPKLESLEDFVKFAKRLRGDQRHERYIFRGEPRFFDIPLAPSILRDETYRELDQVAFTALESREIESARQRYISGATIDRFINAFAPSMHPNDLNWLFYARHVGALTRLIDVTRNPLVALYFACNSDENEDGVVFAFSRGNFRPVERAYSDWLHQLDFPVHPIAFASLLSGHLDSGGNADTPYLISPDQPQERLIAQHGEFVFFSDRTKTLIGRRQIIAATIEAEAKARILDDLKAFGVTSEFLFPNESGAA